MPRLAFYRHYSEVVTPQTTHEETDTELIHLPLGPLFSGGKVEG
jgi:hypothetical protein